MKIITYILLSMVLCSFGISGYAQSRTLAFVEGSRLYKTDRWIDEGNMLSYANVLSEFSEVLPHSTFRIWSRGYSREGLKEIYHEIYAISKYETHFCDPVSLTVKKGSRPRLIYVLFKEISEYNLESIELAKICNVQQEDNSYRDKLGRFVAYPVMLTDNLDEPHLYRGFRVYWHYEKPY